MPNQNGRNVAMPDENRPSWRPQDENQRNRRSMTDEDDRYMSDRDDRYGHWEDRSSRWDRDDGYRSTERYGQGQSGYGAGRYEEDRGYQSRNTGYPSHMEERARERGLDERFSQGRGGGYWGERDEGRRMSGYGHGEYEGRGGYLGQGGQQMGYGSQSYGSQSYGSQSYGSQQPARGDTQWGNEGYSGQRGFGVNQGMYGQGYGPNQGMYGQRYGQGSSYGMSRYGSQGYQGGGQQQSHRGKGPAGYTRSDERIREMVCEALSDDHDVDATNIDVTVKNGEVILSGTVEDRRQKRMAEDCVEQVSGVKDVQNQIRVATVRRSGTDSHKESETSTSSMTSDKKARA